MSCQIQIKLIQICTAIVILHTVLDFTSIIIYIERYIFTKKFVNIFELVKVVVFFLFSVFMRITFLYGERKKNLIIVIDNVYLIARLNIELVSFVSFMTFWDL